MFTDAHLTSANDSEVKQTAQGHFDWFPPTFHTGVTHAHRVASEEVFGPVLSGLIAGVWTDNGGKIFKMVNELLAGVVWANTYNKFDPTSPFGGCKESGFGREGGLQGLAAYCRVD
jgi:acyl-CoA reductase-like NAD-dependent aldehyde dehydrogenase